MLIVTLAAPAAVMAQQPAAAPAKPNASQQADTSKAKAHRRRAHKAKAATTTAPRDTTKAKP
ncbi:MAG: hypothetical protein DMD48_03735 [Gemmatimonadetes bacterium]|nr:MAG: hypothetical protein DMD48_03735 [Gemmatimonadota bacterium]